MKPLIITDLGLISYSNSVALQQRLVAARKAGAISDVLLICEHPHVITLGRNASRVNLLATESVLREKEVEFHETNRGGDVTYHGPGQIVGYPILDLDTIRRDVHWYVRTLEEVMIRATAEFGLSAFRVPGRTGIWVQPPADSHPGDGIWEEKLAAIGVHISRWVTSHGFAYNVSTDLRYFDLIVPCGIAERKATSLEKLLSRSVASAEVKNPLIRQFVEHLHFQPSEISPGELLSNLDQFELIASSKS